MKIKGFVSDPNDNVAFALTDLQLGEELKLIVGKRSVFIKFLDNIPYQHKFSIKPIVGGEEIIRYGEIIGEATKDIAIGEHVHIHNMIGRRLRGKKA